MITKRAIISIPVIVTMGFLAAFSAKAEGTMAQRMACTPDALRLCSSAIPDVDAVKACMIAKKSQLSAACQAMFPKQTASR